MKDSRTGQIEGVVFYQDGDKTKYLALKRNKEKGGYWQPLTGGIHTDEDISDALVRELNEELGLKESQFTIIDPKHSFSFTLQSGKTLQEYVFGIEIQPDQEIRLSDEHTEYRWLPFAEARQLYEWDSNKKAIDKIDELIKRRSTQSL